MLEPLEDRIAPATLVNPHIVTYTDINGDLVTVKSSHSLFTQTNADTILTFNTGSVDGTLATHQQLELINLRSLASNVVAGDNLSITVKGSGGDANVGFIDSSVGLGHVLVQGDLGRIDAGVQQGSNHSVGLVGLTVNSLGALGTSTQVAGGGSLLSIIYGDVGSITVQKDMVDAQISVVSNTTGTAINGSINSVKIGGSLIGGSDTLGGSISTNGNINSIVIGGNMQGAAGQNSASLQVGEKIGSLSVNNMIGYTLAGDTTGQGAGSASIVTGNNFPAIGGIGSLTIKGNLQGGDGSGSAGISEINATGGPIGSVKIGGAIIGGTGNNSGELTANSFGPISVGKGIIGSSGVSSGSIRSGNGITSLAILEGGIVGGTNTYSGAVFAATSPTGAAAIGSVVIHGDITGNSTVGSSIADVAGTGQINGSSISSLTLYGSLIGTTATTSGSIIASASIGHIALFPAGASAGSLLGGSGSDSGDIKAFSIGSVSIAGQVLGGGDSTITGSGAGSGAITSTDTLGGVFIGGSLTGGFGGDSGAISAFSIGSVSIAGQVHGGGDSAVTGSGTGSGDIVSSGNIGSITIGGGLAGGFGGGSGVITTGTGFGNKLGSLNITHGGITGGAGAGSGQVTIGGAIGSVNLHGTAVTGGSGATSGAILATDSIGSISLGSLISSTGAGAGQISTGGNLTSLTFTGVSASTPATTVDTGFVSVSGSAGSIAVHGDVTGSGASTGLFEIGGGVKSFSISGALKGGSAQDSGSIFAGLDNTGVIGSLTVSNGIIGGGGDASGQVFGGGGITRATIGDLIGGSGNNSGLLGSENALGTINVTGTSTVTGLTTHGIVGGDGNASGQISAGSTIASLTVHGALQGGKGTSSGTVLSHSVFGAYSDVQGDIGSISITGSVAEGKGAGSGRITAAGNIKTLTIGGGVTGSLAGGTGGILAGAELTTPSGGNITTLKIGGALQAPIEAGHFGSITVGSIQTGSIGVTGVSDDGTIRAANDIASLKVTGAIAGTFSDPVVISAVGQVTPAKTGDLAFGRISVGKDTGGNSVTYANFLAGYDQSVQPVNGAASIGSVLVAGDWSGSNLVAGVIADSNGHFGDGTLITSSASVIPTIASIIIKGHVIDQTGGPDASGDYAFVAKKIGAVSIGGHPLSFLSNQTLPIPGAADTVIHEIPS